MGRGVRRPAVRQPHRDRDGDRRAAVGGVAERVLARVQPGDRHRAVPPGVGPQAGGSTASGTTPVIDEMSRAPEGVTGPLTPIGPADTVRIVTNDFMFGGGDGYTALAGGTDVLQPGDALLDLVIDDITANSPVAPVVDGRITPDAVTRSASRGPPPYRRGGEPRDPRHHARRGRRLPPGGARRLRLARHGRRRGVGAGGRPIRSIAALATFDRGAIVATLQSFPTELTVPGGAAVAAGGLTAVTCRATHRRQGLLTRMMDIDLRASRDQGEVGRDPDRRRVPDLRSVRLRPGRATRRGGSSTPPPRRSSRPAPARSSTSTTTRSARRRRRSSSASGRSAPA